MLSVYIIRNRIIRSRKLNIRAVTLSKGNNCICILKQCISIFCSTYSGIN